MATVAKILTIGHGALQLEEFLQRLQMHHILALADVRRFPASKRHPHFSRAALSGALNKCEINYHWLGEKLGGYRAGGYEAYAATDAFRDGCEELLRLAQVQPTAFFGLLDRWMVGSMEVQNSNNPSIQRSNHP